MVDRVWIDDNFFEIGGHSLMATQVVSRIAVALGVEIGVARIFEEPTAKGLSLRIEEMIRAGMKLDAPRDGAPEERLWYWNKQLGDKPPVLDLAGARLRPEARAYRLVTKSISLPAELCEPLKALSKREGAALYMVLLSAFKTMLYRYTAESDVVVMAAVSNRNQADTENQIGFSGDLLPLRTNLSGNPRFIQLLKRVKDVVLGAYLHQEAPWEKLIEETYPAQKAGLQLPFNIVFGAQNAPEGEGRLTELQIAPIVARQESSRFDLTLWITKGADTMQAGWIYSVDLFEEEAIVRMHSHFESLLRGVVARPDAPLDELEMLSEAEKTQQAVNLANRKERSYSRFKGVKPKVITPSKE
jgi:hypothetical protein